MKLLHVKGVSACVFGSSARLSQDTLSDKDILLCSKQLSTLYPLVTELKKDGWSVATYSHKRLRHMLNSRSLFMQHLKLEGKIIWDSENWLEEELEKFTPKSCYQKEIIASFDLIRPLERLMRPTQFAQIAGDLGYVFIRNFAINHLASSGIYLFDYRSALEELQVLQGFSSKCLQRLIDLREVKHTYRAGLYNKTQNTYGCEVAADLSEACHELLLKPLDSKEKVRKFDLNYASLRDFETALFANGRFMHKIETPFINAILNPRNYSWQIRSIDDAWIEMATKIIRENTVHLSQNETAVAKNQIYSRTETKLNCPLTVE